MASIRHAVRQAVEQGVGSSFWVAMTTITSSAITTAKINMTSAATGRLAIVQIILKTDGGAITGGTNFEILSNNAKGLVNIAVETFANLTGAVVSRILSGLPPAADTTTSDSNFTVTAVPTVLEAGKKLQYDSTGSAGTGAGKIDIFIKFERIDAGAAITAV